MNNKDKCSSITLWVKRRGKLIVKLKAIKFWEDIFCYLSSYLHHSFFWHLVIVIFIYCIIKLSSQGRDLWLYWERLLVLRTSAHIVTSLDRPQALESLRPRVVREEVLWVVVVPLLLLCLSKCGVTVLNLISSKYFVDDRCVHPPLVNLFYKQARQSASLITDAYIRCRSTSPMDESTTCQDAREERCSYIIYRTARSLSLPLGSLLVDLGIQPSRPINFSYTTS